MKKVKLKTGVRCLCGKNKSIDRTDESNPGSSDESSGIAERSPTLPTHYYSIPTKSQHKAAISKKQPSHTLGLERANTTVPSPPQMMKTSYWNLCDIQ